MITDYFKLAYRSIRNRKLRSWLTMIGIFIGITAVVGLISLGQGMQQSIDQEFESIGKNRLTVSPGAGAFDLAGGGAVVGEITEDDLEVIRKVRGVEVAAGVLIQVLMDRRLWIEQVFWK
jgi:putative ABC transport system permease protein